MTDWQWNSIDVQQLLDVQIYAADGEAIGKVDELEFTDPADGPPVLTAILCGSTAFGPRVGGLWGLAIWSIGRRLAPGDGQPIRIPLTEVSHVNAREIRLHESARSHGTDRLPEWTRNTIINRIPGGSR